MPLNRKTRLPREARDARSSAEEDPVAEEAEDRHPNEDHPCMILVGLLSKSLRLCASHNYATLGALKRAAQLMQNG